ncbi:nitrogenase component 1 [Acetivibrio clariflavus]|uniref:Nitrogenase molybdenum-iron protein, alpha and beta chains n=1 Tax=Acetivibrio clariflavus (strain DSM 19732 / NBRC 101661 / EBR45) TaxID=720554 RepID=G8LYB9_ACECE|nr:nitrogenase component 1 [Acetivibrio clariflavus]AEV68888.1 nitrogenase molybdenum-iron protein, alpha and beta chains [Acetivibrio clariflavus DSM 19732]
MNYISEKVPPVREDRLKACNAFGGSCCELARKGKKGCLNGVKRTFAQTQGCQLNLSLAILNTIRNAVIVVHGPIGCGGGSLSMAGVNKGFQKLRDPNAKGVIWLNTNLDDNDVVNGGEEKLRQAVLYAEREFRPEAIIVVNSCVPAIIGDDIDSILEDLQKQVNAKIVPVHCEGFKTKIMASAYDSVYHGILRNLVDRPEEEEKVVYEDELEVIKEKYRKSRTVNILNVSSMSRQDEEELIRLVKALGLEVRIYPCYASPDDFAYVGEAALNVSICATHDDYFVEHIKEKYGIPFVLRSIPIGIKNTNQWIMDIASFFGLEEKANKLIEVETKELKEALEPFKEQLKGKRVFLGGGEIRILSTAELLQSMGMEVIGLKGYHYDRFAEPLLDMIENNENIVFNVATGQPFEQANLLNRLKPDLYIGHIGTNGYTAKQGFPIFPLFGQSSIYMGYQGAYEIVRKIARVLRNPSFNRNFVGNSKLPYRDEWYEQNPFTYIDDSAAL